MQYKTNAYIVVLSSVLFFLSLTALLLNSFIYKYPANNYFPADTIHIGYSVFLFYLGLILLVGKNTRLSRSGLELLYFFVVMSLIALATNAVQLTPFPPIDTEIISFESLFHINMSDILAWTHNHPYIRNLLGLIYDSLSWQMCFLPLFVLTMGKFERLREYYFLLLFTALIGFSFYYFYPTTAPASNINSPYFTPYQIATGLKFTQIHHYKTPTTLEGGLIALPSFHCIWALLCVYLLKDWKIPCLILLFVNSILIISCVLIGWHYPSDIAGGIVLFALAYSLLTRFRKNI
jgi:membrane-associated phospholipid phosphatase